jgi:hypothetical protein
MMAMDERSVWYREPFVWMLILIPFAAVVGGVATLILAVWSDDGLVADDYYWRGKQINRVLSRDQAAARKAINADLSFDFGRGVVKAALRARAGVKLPGTVQFAMLHSTRAGLDRTLELNRTPQGDYYGMLPVLASGRWYLQIEAEDWRLIGAMRVPDEITVHIAPVATE